MTTATRPASNTPAQGSYIQSVGYLISPERAGSLAIIANGRVYICLNRDPYQQPPRLTSHALRGSDLTSLAPVAKWALSAGVENVFILPGSGRMAQRFHELASVSKMQEEAGEPYTFHEVTSRGLLAAQLAGVVADTGPKSPLVTIWAPSALGIWNLDELPQDIPDEERASDLAYAWLLASYALGARLRFSPSYSGLSLLRKILCATRRPFPSPSEKYRALILAAQARPLGFIAPAREVPNPDELVKVWSYDRNWSYVSSARMVPVGDPTRVMEFVPNRPGFYRITATQPERWGARPDPFQRGKLQNIWAWEPTMRLALAQGWGMQILDGYAWVGQHTSYDLRPWTERMWNARNELSRMIDMRGVPAIAAKGIVSQIGRATIGRLKQQHGRMLVEEDSSQADELVRLELDTKGRLTGLAEVKAEIGRSDLYRPEWWSTIIASASERALTASYQHGPYDSLAGWVDACYFPSPRGLEGDTNKVGGWHIEHKGVAIPARVAYGGDLGRFVTAVARAARNG